MKNEITNLTTSSVNIDSIFTVYHQTHQKAGWVTKQTNRSAEGLALVLNGTAIYDFGDRKVFVSPNDILYLRKGDSYVSSSPETSSHYTIILVNYLYDETRSADALPLTTRIAVNPDSPIPELFDELLNVWTNNTPFARIKASSILYNIIYLLSLMCIQNATHTRNQQKIIESVNYIESNFRKPISLAELAKLSHISISHLVRSFAQTYKVSPIEYLIQVRLKHAKRLLRSQSYTVSEIAEKTGFNSINYFSRVFKYHEGMCPSKYQKAATSDHV